MDVLSTFDLEDITSLLKLSLYRLKDFDIYKPITVDSIIAYDNKKISALLFANYTLYFVDKSLEFYCKYDYEIEKNCVKKISIGIQEYGLEEYHDLIK